MKKIVLGGGIIIVVVLVFQFGLSFQGQLVNDPQISAEPSEPETIVVPVYLHIVSEPSGYYGSYRSERNLRELFDDVNRIWDQARIHFEIQDIRETSVSENAIPNALNSNTDELLQHPNFEAGQVNVFFTQSLNNINGLALMSLRSALVADFTTVNDYRTTAHELGHLINLRHVRGDHYLMAQGRNGEQLTEEEINIARKGAYGLLGILI